MKIGIYTPYLESLSGGERYMLTIASCLSHDNEVSLFWDDTTIKEKAEKKLGIDLSKITVTKNIFSWSTWKKLQETKKYDVIFVLSDGSIPFVFTNLYLHFQHPMEEVHRSLFDKIKIRRVKKIICNSVFTKKFIDKKYNVESVVLYPPVDVSSLKSLVKENSILTVGRFSLIDRNNDFKKQSVLIEAFRRLREKNRGVTLTVVTSAIDSDEKSLDEFIKKYQGEGITFVISPSFEQLQKLYGKAKVYWHAAGYGEDLQKNPERAEHFGISTVEAMSAGCIPVVFNGGGQKEIIQENENGFLWNTEKELIEKTQQVFNNKSLQSSLVTSAQEKSQKFSEDAFCKNLTDIMKE